MSRVARGDDDPAYALLLEACERLPHTPRAMFGGHGLFAPNGAMFAAQVDEGAIALKLIEPEAQEEFIALGAAPWSPRAGLTMGGWFVVPMDLLDEPRQLADWCQRAHATAKPSKPKKTSAKKPAAKKARRK